MKVRTSWKRIIAIIGTVFTGFAGTQLDPDESSVYSNAVIAILAALAAVTRKEK